MAKPPQVARRREPHDSRLNVIADFQVAGSDAQPRSDLEPAFNADDEGFQIGYAAKSVSTIQTLAAGAQCRFAFR